MADNEDKSSGSGAIGKLAIIPALLPILGGFMALALVLVFVVGFLTVSNQDSAAAATNCPTSSAQQVSLTSPAATPAQSPTGTPGNGMAAAGDTTAKSATKYVATPSVDKVNITVAKIAYEETVARTNDPRVLEAVFAAGLAESEFKNLANSNVPSSTALPNDGTPGSNMSSVGFLQQQVGNDGKGTNFSWGTVTEAMDPHHATAVFVNTAIAKASSVTGTAAQLAQAVQSSDSTDATIYTKKHDEALALIESVKTGAATTAEAIVSASAPTSTANPCPTDPAASGEIDHNTFDPGNIITDDVMYNATAMSESQIRDFINTHGADCSSEFCLKSIHLDTQTQPADTYCDEYPGAKGEDAARMIAKFSLACHVNPQVMLVTLQKESQLLDRTDTTLSRYDAAWGWHCPDTGPGGSANCDPAYAGFFNQGYGMAKQWSRYKHDINDPKYNYKPGPNDIQYDVSKDCGSSTVQVLNVATASLYNYTPYQPNAASLAAYPGEGDACSSYGNRNFFFMFIKYFGSTGGGKPKAGTGGGPAAAGLSTDPNCRPGNTVHETDKEGGQQYDIAIPNTAGGKAACAALSALGVPYAWGGGGKDGPSAGTHDGCSDLCIQYQDWAHDGFDCSGLTQYAWYVATGKDIGDYTGAQLADNPAATGDRQVGDLILWNSTQVEHVALYLGKDSTGVEIIVEAMQSGTQVHIAALARKGTDYAGWRRPAA